MTPDLKQIVEKECESMPGPYKAGYKDGADFALTMNRWTPISERLPENRQRVLATDGSTQIVLEYKHGCWFVGLDQIHFVTHWQPLPPPPVQP